MHASLRVRRRKDRTGYTSVLDVHEGKASSNLNDHVEALQLQNVCNRIGPTDALRIWQAAKPVAGHTVKSFVGEHLDSLPGVE